MTSSEVGIHALPDEILCQIFLFIFPRDTGQFFAGELDLSYVCSRWKAVALSLSPLWSSIFVLGHEDPESEGVRRLTQLYLERSGNSPLDLFLHIGDGTSIMDMLYTQAHRWRRVHLVTKVRRNLQDLGHVELSLLESLSLTLIDDHPLTPVSINRMWSKAPRLHTFCLDVAIFGFEQFEIPWHQLRHLTMESLDVDQMHKALCLCTSVVSAIFSSCTNDFSFRDPVSYTCPFLSSLTIVADHRLETLGPDITHCFYPSLSTLVLISGEQEFSFSHGIIPNLTSLVIRSECRLTSLTLHGISYSSKHFMELLQVTSSSLIKLDLCDVDHRAWNFLQLQSWLFQALIWLPTTGATEQVSAASHSQVPGHLLPRLREFGIRFPTSRREIIADREKLGVVLRMIESRRPSLAFRANDDGTKTFTDNIHNLSRHNPGSKDMAVGMVLEKLHLGRLWSTRVPLKFEKRLRALENDGLKITAL